MVAALLAVGLAAINDPVELYRTFSAGSKFAYRLESKLLTETRSPGMAFFLPDEFELGYGFAIEVKEVKSDGFARMLYSRPTMVFTQGETAEAPPKTTTERVGWKIEMTLSPVNEVTESKDLAPAKPPKTLLLMRPNDLPMRQQVIGALFSQIQGLALFSGSLDSALDLAPKLPLEEVKPGDTWKQTVGYQPRALKGSDIEAMQRLDYVYTYEGLTGEGEKRRHRVVAKLKLETDAAKYINQTLGMKPAESGLNRVDLKLDTQIVFELDPKTLDTLTAKADSKGGFTIELTEDPGTPAYEQRLTGSATLQLVSRT